MADMSFLPNEYLEKRAERRTNVISLTLFVVVMGAVVAAFFVTDRQRAEVKKMQSQVDRQYEEAAKRLEQLEVLQERKKQMVRKAEVTGKLMERVPRSLVLAELINNMPASLSLLDFGLETKVSQRRGPATNAMQAAKNKIKDTLAKKDDAPELPPTEVTVDLTGVAATDVQVAQFMASLDRSNMFTDMNLIFSEEVKINEQKMRKFRLKVVLNQDVDLTEYEPLMVQRGLNHNPMDKKVGFDKSGKPLKDPNATPVVVGKDNPAVQQVTDHIKEAKD